MKIEKLELESKENPISEYVNRDLNISLKVNDIISYKNDCHRILGICSLEDVPYVKLHKIKNDGTINKSSKPKYVRVYGTEDSLDSHLSIKFFKSGDRVFLKSKGAFGWERTNAATAYQNNTVYVIQTWHSNLTHVSIKGNYGYIHPNHFELMAE